MKLALTLSTLLFLMCGCSSFGTFLADVGTAAKGEEVGQAGSDTTAEQFVDAVKVVQPSLPPVVGYLFSAIFSGLAVYSHLSKKNINSETEVSKKGDDEIAN